MVCTAALALPSETLHHRIRLQGHGPRTVSPSEAGLGDTLDVWKDVQPLISAGCTRTLAYTRAGYLGKRPRRRYRATPPRSLGSCEQSCTAGTSLHIPNVLVGHSLGGLYMQYFARNYPKEVAGLVLVDSTHLAQRLFPWPTPRTRPMRDAEP